MKKSILIATCHTTQFIFLFLPGDTVPPVITSCPADQTMFVPFLSTGTAVSWTEPVVSDNSGNFDTLQTHASGSFFPVGDTTVTYTFRDAANNEAVCSFVVRVIELGQSYF